MIKGAADSVSESKWVIERIAADPQSENTKPQVQMRQKPQRRREFGPAFGKLGREVVLKLSAAWGGLAKHKPLVDAALTWLQAPSPKLIPPLDRLAIGGGFI